MCLDRVRDLCEAGSPAIPVRVPMNDDEVIATVHLGDRTKLFAHRSPGRLRQTCEIRVGDGDVDPMICREGLNLRDEPLSLVP